MTRRRILQVVWIVVVLVMAWFCGRVYERRQIVERAYEDARRR